MASAGRELDFVARLPSIHEGHRRASGHIRRSAIAAAGQPAAKLRAQYAMAMNLLRLDLTRSTGTIRGRLHNREEECVWYIDRRIDEPYRSESWIEVTQDMLLPNGTFSVHFELTKGHSTHLTVSQASDQLLVRPRNYLGLGSVMTDGCGLISRAAALLIARSAGLDSLPAAFQARLGGAKGRAEILF